MSKNKKVEVKVTQEMIEKKVRELCDMIEKFDDKSGAANFACFEIVSSAAYCHYHGLGILEETLLEWREFSLERFDDEDEEKPTSKLN